MSEKTITGWLIVDWKNGSHRTRKSKPSATDLGANELRAKLQIDVSVPEVETPTLGLEIDVPEPQVHAAELASIPEDEHPAWTAIADEKLAEREHDVLGSESPDDLRSVVMELTSATLMDAPGRPAAETVEQYLHESVEALLGGDADE